MFKYLVKFLKILIILCIIGVSIRVIDIKFNKKNYAQKEESITKNPMETVLAKLSSDEEIKENNIIDTEKLDVQKEDVINYEKVEDKKVDKTVNIVENKEQEQTKTQKVEVKQEKITNEEQPKEENKNTEEKPVVQEQEKTEEKENIQTKIIDEYKVNNQMINRIKEVINNNLSEDMKEYGYNIVEDSSIPELTNEFTFTEQRVINKIKFKSGTIRIYARDYYYNGNYVNTQCFII